MTTIQTRSRDDRRHQAQEHLLRRAQMLGNVTFLLVCAEQNEDERLMLAMEDLRRREGDLPLMTMFDMLTGLFLGLVSEDRDAVLQVWKDQSVQLRAAAYA